MFLNNIKFLNKNNLSVRKLVRLCSFPELNESFNSYEKLNQFRIVEAFWSTVAKNRFDFHDVITGETLKEILRNKYIQALKIEYLMNDLFSQISNTILNLLKYLEDKSLRKMVKYLY